MTDPTPEAAHVDEPFGTPSIGGDGYDAWFRPCFIYVIASGDSDRPVKIGVSVDVQRRIHALEAGNPHGLRALHQHPVCVGIARQAERRLHRRFAAKAMGREWFDITAAEAWAMIPEVCLAADAHTTALRREFEEDDAKHAAANDAAKQARDTTESLRRAIAMNNFRRLNRRAEKAAR